MVSTARAAGSALDPAGVHDADPGHRSGQVWEGPATDSLLPHPITISSMPLALLDDLRLERSRPVARAGIQSSNVAAPLVSAAAQRRPGSGAAPRREAYSERKLRDVERKW